MDWTFLLHALWLGISHIAAVEYIIFQYKFLPVDRIFHYTMMPIQLCIKECEKLESCVSVNFNKENFTCSLHGTSHLENNLQLIDSSKFVYALLTKKTPGCNSCNPHASCQQLSSGRNICVENGCPSTSYLVKHGEVSMSSVYHLYALMDRYWLDSDLSWSPSNAVSSWIQVVFPSPKYVFATVTQGRARYPQWAISYKLYIKNISGIDWIPHPTIFPANTDSSTKKYNYLYPILLTDGIRIAPVTWHDAPSLRFDVIGCSP